MANGFSLYDPNQFVNQLTGNTMAPYQYPGTDIPIDWGIGNYLQNLDASQLNFGGGTPINNSTGGGGFSMNWGNIGKGLNIANSALTTIGLIDSIFGRRSDRRLMKRQAQRSFNANAILANNAIRQRENAGRAFASAHGINYTPDHVPLKMISGWGKSGKDVGI